MADKCYAPVFDPPRSWVACLVLVLIYTLAIVAILIGTLFLCLLFPSCVCTIKQYLYRIKHCSEGNTNANVPL